MSENEEDIIKTYNGASVAPLFEPNLSNDCEFELLEQMTNSLASIANSLEEIVKYILLEYEEEK